MANPELREAYAQVVDEFALIEALVHARTAAKLTQADFVPTHRRGATQSAINRGPGAGGSLNRMETDSSAKRRAQ